MTSTVEFKVEVFFEVGFTNKQKIKFLSLRAETWKPTSGERHSAQAEYSTRYTRTTPLRKKITPHKVRSNPIGAGGGTWTHMLSPTSDFESDASAIPPHQHVLNRRISPMTWRINASALSRAATPAANATELSLRSIPQHRHNSAYIIYHKMRQLSIVLHHFAQKILQSTLFVAKIPLYSLRDGQKCAKIIKQNKRLPVV